MTVALRRISEGRQRITEGGVAIRERVVKRSEMLSLWTYLGRTLFHMSSFVRATHWHTLPYPMLTAPGGRHKGTGIRMSAVLIPVLGFFSSNLVLAQRTGLQETGVPVSNSMESSESSAGSEAKAPRRTPFGIQVSLGKEAQTPQPVASSESADRILQRTGTAYGSELLSRADMVAEGTVTVYTASEPLMFGVMLQQSGELGSLRIQLQQPDGKLWDGKGEHLSPGGRRALEFLQTQYTRGLRQLLDSSKREAAVVDIGTTDAARWLTVLEKSGDSTKYLLDPATSRVSGFEFERGHSRDSGGNGITSVHSYAFGDFRTFDEVAAPFHVEHFVNGVKQEELQLTRVRHSGDRLGAAASAARRQ